jgi:hypothetical protein
MPLNIKEGMSFSEILSHGDSEDMFATLSSDSINQLVIDLHKNSESDIAILLNKLTEADPSNQTRLADAIAAYFTNAAVKLDNEIQSDLQAQQAIQTQLANLNIAAEMLPPEQIAVPKFIDLVATDRFREIFNLPVA